MASSQIAIIPAIGKEGRKVNSTRMPRISTATLPGLLLLALEDKASHDRTIFFLQQGAKAMNALECLEDGNPDALDYARTLITGMVRDLYRQAEKA